MSSQLSPQAAEVFVLRQTDHGLQPDPQCAIRGFVDALDASKGISGWVADSRSGHSQIVSLWLDDVQVSSASPQAPRPDIWMDRSIDRSTGFTFEVDDLLRVALRDDISPAAVLTVRALEGQVYLPCAGSWTFADIQVLRAPPLSVDYLEGQSGPLRPELARLARKAFRQVNQPLRAVPHKHAGVIEYAARLSDTLLLVGGWMQASLPPLCAMVLVAPAFRRAAAWSVVTAARTDLPPSARAFAGVLHVEDGLEVSDLQDTLKLFFAGLSLDWLNPVAGLRRPATTTALEEVESLFERSEADAVRDLRALIRQSLPWERKAQGFSMGVKAGVDQCLVVPRFGLFVRGWLLHATGQLVKIQAKLGNAQFASDANALSLSPRNDLAGAFPSLADRTGTAGFAVMLRGDALPDQSDPWLLRFEFSDGAVHLHEVAPGSARIIGADCALTRISEVMPRFEWAPWLVEMVEAVARHARQSVRNALQWQGCAIGKTALICALPVNVAHQRIALEGLLSGLRHWRSAKHSLMIMLPTTFSPGLWESWMAVHASTLSSLRISFFRVPAGGDVWWALSETLRESDIDRFVFIGPEVLLTAAGGVACLRHLDGEHLQISLMNVGSLLADSEVVVQDANAFGWTKLEFLEHVDETSSPLPGLWRTQGLPLENVCKQTGQDIHAMRLSRTALNPLQDQINTRLLHPGAQRQAAHALGAHPS